MKLLLEAGLNPLAKSDLAQFKGKTVIDAARQMVEGQAHSGFIGNTKPILEMLEKAAVKPAPPPSAPNRDLGKAAANGDAPALRKLLDEGATYIPNKTIPSLLFLAGSPEVAELLIQRGADVAERNSAGETALAFITRYGKKNTVEVARALLKHGADVNAKTNFDETPIMFARDGATVDLLIEAGADLKVKNEMGQSVLTVFRMKGEVSAYEALLRHGVPFDPKTDGPRMLTMAAQFNNVSLIPWLLEKGVDPNTPAVLSAFPAGGQSPLLPLDAAAMGGQAEAARLLLKAGAKERNR